MPDDSAPSMSPPLRKLRIAYVADVFGDSFLGGVQSSNRFVEALRERYEVTVITTGEPREGTVTFPAWYVPGFRKLQESAGFAFAWPNAKKLEEILRGFDLVHIQYALPLGYVAKHVAQKLGIPTVCASHVQPENVRYTLHLDFRYFDWIGHLLYRFFIGTFFNRAEHVICPSRFALDELRRYGFNRPATIITNGLPERFAPSEAPVPRLYEDKFVILMVGRLAREKRHDVVIEAICRSRFAARIQLVATGMGPYQKQIEEYAALLPNPARVGFVSNEELVQLYNGADLFVHASEAELEGMAVLEAIGCGLPALISNSKTSAAKQFALDERYLFQAGDLLDLTRKIDFLIEHPDILQQARGDYRRKALEYDFTDAVEVTCELYERMAGSRDEGRGAHPRSDG